MTDLPDKFTEWDEHNQLTELAELGFWVRRHTPPETTIAVSWHHPVLHFHHYAQRKVVQDELEPLYEYVVTPAWQAGIAPDYLLCSRHIPLRSHVAGKRRLELAMQSEGGFYRLYRFVPASRELSQAP